MSGLLMIVVVGLGIMAFAFVGLRWINNEMFNDDEEEGNEDGGQV